MNVQAEVAISNAGKVTINTRMSRDSVQGHTKVISKKSSEVDVAGDLCRSFHGDYSPPHWGLHL